MATAGLLQTSLIWVTYAVAVALALFVAIITIITWQTHVERSGFVTSIAIFSLTALLATVLLVPVDIALVSATTSPALGARKDWASDGRVASITKTLEIVYYSLYSLDTLLCLLILPFAYFWYEQDDEVDDPDHRPPGPGRRRSFASRFRGAIKYTLGFVVLIIVLFMVGFFVPAAGVGTQPDRNLDLDYFKRLLSANRGEKAFTFALGLLITLGTLLYILYTGAGLALLPISLVKSAPSISAPQLSETTASALEENRERQRQLEMRHGGRSSGDIPQKDQREMDALLREERTLVRRQRVAAEAWGEGRGSVYRAWTKLQAVFRPLKLVGGLLLLLIAVLIWVSMLITGIDRAANSTCKQHCGYILGHTNVFQPINWVFVQLARVFPIDYILMAFLVLFLFMASVSGLAAIGIRFLWVRIFQIKKGRTTPQALLIMSGILALIILAINYSVVMMAAPQYATYGTQTFCINPPRHPGEKPDCSGRPDLVRPCSEVLSENGAGKVCTPTVLSTVLGRVTLFWPVLGAIDFWGQFAFLAVFLIVLVTSLFRTPRLNLSEIDEEAAVDEEEGLLAGTGRRFGAAWQDVTGRAGQSQSQASGAYGGTASQG